MSVLKPFNRLPSPNSATILLVENEEQFQQSLAESMAKETDFTVNVRLAKYLPLPLENEETRPRIDLVVFIINLTSELSLKAAETSLKYLDPGYFLGKVCFMVTNARVRSVPVERLNAVRKLAASKHCPLLFAEHQLLVGGVGRSVIALLADNLQIFTTPDGVSTASERLMTILKVSAGLVPMVTALYLSTLTRCTVPPDMD